LAKHPYNLIRPHIMFRKIMPHIYYTPYSV
jgi:hypothetical protein